MAIDGRVIIKVDSNADKASMSFNRLDRSLQQGTRSAKTLDTTTKRLGTTMARYIGASAVILGLRQSIKLWDQQEKAVAQVRAGIEATGGVANKTLEELIRLSEDLQRNTLFGDEQILAGATAQLLTFTNIANKEFDRTQQAVLDVATRLASTNGGIVDLTSTAIMLGKALNDPVANLGALGRSGIQFTQDQKDVIKALFEAGETAEAQRIILKELEKQYGGSATAAAKAGAGGLTQFKNVLSDITEVLGKQIGEPLAEFGSGLAGDADAADRAKESVAALGESIVILGKAISLTTAPLRAAKAGLQEIASFAGNVTQSLKLGESLGDAIRSGFDDTGRYVDEFEKKTVDQLKSFRESIGDLFTTEAEEEAIKASGEQAGKVFADGVTAGVVEGDVKREVKDVADEIGTDLSRAFSDGILEPLEEGESAFERFRSVVSNVLADIARQFLTSGIKDILTGSGSNSGGLIGSIITGVSAAFGGSTVPAASKGGIIGTPGSPVQGFASGGIIPKGDNQIIGANTGEMMLNKKQQRNLYDQANGQGGNGTIINITPPAGYTAEVDSRPDNETDIFFKKVTGVMSSPRSNDAFDAADFRRNPVGVQAA